MTLGNDHTSGNFKLAFRTNKDTARGAGSISGLTDDAWQSDLACVGKRKLHLGFLTERAKYGHIAVFSFGSPDCEAFLTEVLTRLAEFFDIVQLGILSEEKVKILLGNVNMPG